MKQLLTLLVFLSAQAVFAAKMNCTFGFPTDIWKKEIQISSFEYDGQKIQLKDDGILLHYHRPNYDTSTRYQVESFLEVGKTYKHEYIPSGHSGGPTLTCARTE